MIIPRTFMSKSPVQLLRALRPAAIVPARHFTSTRTQLDAQSQGTKIIQPMLGVAAALKANSDSSFQPKAQIFDEFALKDGVAVVGKIHYIAV
ncbi:hypothetical protein QFC19_002660 [Naganishia cerealis]|uniref:Uncharacterized protein n=1 Tax=Naganishia cerealis TaxID=610337 RepID=A0ACC2W8E6_9TREE|nr:hypothetical protein QFC19_002660 [Naganishia cerealis]